MASLRRRTRRLLTTTTGLGVLAACVALRGGAGLVAHPAGGPVARDWMRGAWRHAATTPEGSGDAECVPVDTAEPLDATSDDVFAKWGVCVAPETSFAAGGLRFNCVDPAYQIETFEFSLTRAPGLGIQLEEVANNGDETNPVGVVCVAGCLDGSPAAASPLRRGDVLSAVGPAAASRTGEPPRLKDVEAMVFDDLFAALGAVEEETVAFVAKRLVRRPTVAVTVKYPAADARDDERFSLYGGENLRRAMLVRGVKLNDPLARRFDSQGVGGDCGAEGTCCTCAVAVLPGTTKGVLSEAKTQERQMMSTMRTPTWRLACKALVGADMQPEQQADLVVRVNPRQHEG